MACNSSSSLSGTIERLIMMFLLKVAVLQIRLTDRVERFHAPASKEPSDTPPWHTLQPMMIPRSETRLAWPPVDHRFRDKSAGELALYGGIAVVGFAIGGSVPSSLEILLLVPEALQAIGSGRGLPDPHRCFFFFPAMVEGAHSCEAKNRASNG
ncbi:uncharacterized protein LOC9638396 [Selaginella moellendorffii]|uniref:uncharacterized protein LOC9638396 n=1 Tax=Selaginella moellendorffii TaxID=88036 RepID=UPI000D1C3482|nr:uncharacterized protein LOC9638396 [Selaginella moellendorffii]|eukprot:XP_024537630.1 uncharacterized protein LOC9638396 [Selaginella moellendorffii]